MVGEQLEMSKQNVPFACTKVTQPYKSQSYQIIQKSKCSGSRSATISVRATRMTCFCATRARALQIQINRLALSTNSLRAMDIQY